MFYILLSVNEYFKKQNTFIIIIIIIMITIHTTFQSYNLAAVCAHRMI